MLVPCDGARKPRGVGPSLDWKRKTNVTDGTTNEKSSSRTPSSLPKLDFDTIHYLLPSPGSGLAKQPCRRIPGAILAFQKPAPIAALVQHDPYGFAHGPGQMRNATIDRDHQIQIGDNRRRVGKILQLRRKIDQAPIGRYLLHLLASRAQL